MVPGVTLGLLSMKFYSPAFKAADSRKKLLPREDKHYSLFILIDLKR